MAVEAAERGSWCVMQFIAAHTAPIFGTQLARSGIKLARQAALDWRHSCKGDAAASKARSAPAFGEGRQ